ncbi:MAG: hypothetical protein JW729_03690 [Bacteroidales bacterium]|nr:hypothetical protein [Bacteroidales bacterium]
MKKFFRLITSLLFLSSFLALSSCSNQVETVVYPTAKIAKETKVYSTLALQTSEYNKKYNSEIVGTAYPGQNILILETGGWEKYKIQLPDGTMGWIDAQYIAPEKHTFIKINGTSTNRHIASNIGAVGANRKIVKEVNEKTAVTRLEEVSQEGARGSIIDWTRVRTEDGIEGWIMSDYLYRIVQDTPRIVARKDWQYGLKSFNKSWVGEPISDFWQKYKEPSGIALKDGKTIQYFNNIYLFEGPVKYFGTRVYVKDGLIESIDGGGRKTNWIGYLPLSSALRIDFLANYIGNWQTTIIDEDNPEAETKQLSDYMPEWLSYVVMVLIFLTFLAILYFILKLPYYILNRFLFKVSLDRKLYNGRILTYAIIGTLLVGYPYYVLVTVHIYPFNDFFWITSLFSLGMLFGNFSKWRNDLDYNRCNASTCHRWTGTDNGTEFLGGNTVTQRVRFSDGSSETNRQTTRKYRDYRLCSACGHEWSIVRTEVIGKLRV